MLFIFLILVDKTSPKEDQITKSVSSPTESLYQPSLPIPFQPQNQNISRDRDSPSRDGPSRDGLSHDGQSRDEQAEARKIARLEKMIGI